MKGLDKILKGFNKTVAELQSLEASNAVDAAKKRDKATTLVSQAEAKELEAQQAANVRSNIEKLLGGE